MTFPSLSSRRNERGNRRGDVTDYYGLLEQEVVHVRADRAQEDIEIVQRRDQDRPEGQIPDRSAKARAEVVRKAHPRCQWQVAVGAHPVRDPIPRPHPDLEIKRMAGPEAESLSYRDSQDKKDA